MGNNRSCCGVSFVRKRLNRVVSDLSTPPIPEVQGWSAAYTGAYGPLIQLSQAVPGYAPHPDLLRWTAEAALDTDAAGYGLIEGEPELLEAYSAHASALYGSKIGPEEVQITAGSLVVLGIVLALLVSPWFMALSAFVGAGLTFSGLSGTCAMASILAHMPWNKSFGEQVSGTPALSGS